MKKLGKLKLKAEKMLSYEELVSFRGGSGILNCEGGKKQYYCTCVGSTGSWFGCYYSQTEAEDRADVNCASQIAICAQV